MCKKFHLIIFKTNELELQTQQTKIQEKQQYHKYKHTQNKKNKNKRLTNAGVPLYKSRKSLLFSIIIATTFGSFTPLGIGVGWALEDALGGWSTDLLVCIAAGTFLYVSLVEVLLPEFSQEKQMETQVLIENERSEQSKSSRSQQVSPLIHNAHADMRIGHIGNTPTFESASAQSLMLESLKQQSFGEDALKMTFVVAGFGIMSALAIWV